MSRGLNKVMIIGHLGKDPEMRLTPSGRAVTSNSVEIKMIIHDERKKPLKAIEMKTKIT